MASGPSFMTFVALENGLKFDDFSGESETVECKFSGSQALNH